MEQIECSEMLPHKIRTLGHHQKEEYTNTICHLHVVSTAVWYIDMIRSFQLHFQQLNFRLIFFPSSVSIRGLLEKYPTVFFYANT